MNFLGFTDDEGLPYGVLLIITVYIFFSNYKKGAKYFWSPITVILMVFSYYCLLGPYQAMSTGKTFDRLVDMRPFYSSAFWGALISVLSCIVGFNLNREKGKKIDYETNDLQLGYYGKWLCVIGFIFFTISTGGNVGKLLNPFNAEMVGREGGSLANYFALSLNFMIPGIVFLFVSFVKTKKDLLWLLGSSLIALGIFTTLGFRFRIVLLFLACAITYYLIKNQRPNLVFTVIGVFLFISLMGIIGKTRSYGSGLQLEMLDKSKQSNYESGLNETKIFQTSGAVIDYVPGRLPYAGFQPIVSALLFPIPRAIYQSKSSADYSFNVIIAIYGKKASKGAAFLMYAEQYLSFGWLGIVGWGIAIGWFYKKIWVWYLANSQNTLAIGIYSIAVSFLYVIISRGYLPQVTMLFFFTVFPVYVVRWLIKRRSPVIVRKQMISRAA